MPLATPWRRASAILIALASPTAALADGGIADYAPARSFLVIQIDDWTAMGDAFDRTSLGALWREPSVQGFLEQANKDVEPEFEAALEAIGVKMEDLHAPAGHAGVALFMPAQPDNDDGPPAPEFLISLDFGPNADAWEDTLDRLLERAVADRTIETRDDEYGGASITVIRPKPREGDIEEFDAPGGFLRTLEGMRDREQYLVARVGTSFVISTELAALEGAIDGLSGRGVDSVSGTAAYRSARGLHARESHATAVFVVEPVRTVFAELMADDPMMPFDPSVFFEMLGVTSINAVSFAVRFDTPEAAAEATTALLLTEKKGLIGLVGSPAGLDGSLTPPAFVGPDAYGATQFTFNFGGVLDVIRSMIAGLPEEVRAQARPAFEETANLIGPALAQLGPNIHIFGSYARPFTPDSQLGVVAIQVRDPLIISNTMTFLAGQTGGLLTPRDFGGNMIYSSDAFPVAIGLGFGHIFLGSVTAVENAMRAAANPDGPRLATEPAFARATGVLNRGAAMASYADLRQEFQWMLWSLQNADKIQEEAFDWEGWTPEEKEEFLKAIREETPAFMKHLPPAEVITRHVGATVSELRSVPEGYVSRTLWFNPD